MEFHEGQIGIREGNQWFFIEIIDNNLEKIKESFEILKKETGTFKIIGGN